MPPGGQPCGFPPRSAREIVPVPVSGAQEMDRRRANGDFSDEADTADTKLLLINDVVFMSNEESHLFEFLKRCPHRFVSLDEIVLRGGEEEDFCRDPNWVQAILRRMEIEGWVERNPEGEFRLKRRADETTSFKKALETPGAPLGDTTIISLADVGEDRAEAV